jgi:hypothetical protein
MGHGRNVMGFQFRKIFSIIPGIRLNLSKSGISTSLGKRGATVNIGNHGAKATVGIPGSGMSYSERIGTGKGRGWGGWVLLAAVVVIWAMSRYF